MGPLITAEHHAKVSGYVDLGVEEGADLVVDGRGFKHADEPQGFFIGGCLFDRVKTDMRIYQEEIFGPVLCVMEFEDVEDAVQIANSTPYGLAAGVWTSNLGKAHQMVRAIKTGVVHVNCYGGADISLPLGGVKQSGNGHDRSLHAMDKFTDLKTAWFSI